MKDLNQRVKKLVILRDIRREKLRNQGKFFLSGDDQHYSRVKLIQDEIEAMEKQLTVESESILSSRHQKSRETAQAPHRQDKFYLYYNQADFDLGSLVQIRYVSVGPCIVLVFLIFPCSLGASGTSTSCLQNQRGLQESPQFL